MTRAQRMSTMMFVLRRNYMIWLTVRFSEGGEGVKVVLLMLSNLVFGIYVTGFQKMKNKKQ